LLSVGDNLYCFFVRKWGVPEQSQEEVGLYMLVPMKGNVGTKREIGKTSVEVGKEQRQHCRDSKCSKRSCRDRTLVQVDPLGPD